MIPIQNPIDLGFLARYHLKILNANLHAFLMVFLGLIPTYKQVIDRPVAVALVLKSSAAHSLDQYWMERHQVSQIKSHRCDQTKPSKYNYNLCLCFLVWRRQLRFYCMSSNLNQTFKRRKKCANLSKLKGAAICRSKWTC